MQVTVEIYINKMIVSADNVSKTFLPEEPFSTQRLLVGSFDSAKKCLKSALKEMGYLRWYKHAPQLIIVAKALNEGGLSEIEERVLTELAHAVISRHVEIRHA